MIDGNKNNMECAALKHAGEASLSLADGQCLRDVVPDKRDGRVCTFFVVVVIVFVFVERELSVCAAIDAEFEWIGRFLGSVLDIGTERNDRSGTNEKRKTIERSGNVKCTSALRAAPVQKSYQPASGR